MLPAKGGGRKIFMKEKKLWKQILVVCLLAVLVFLGVSLFWYGFKYRPYKKCVEKMSLDNDSETPRYTAVKGNYQYRVKMPRFLSFESGFLYVGPVEELSSFVVDEEGNMTEKNTPHVDMFIWPKLFSGADYGVTLYEETYSEQVFVDRDGKLLGGNHDMSEQEETALKELYEKHRDEVQDMFLAAADFWGEK